MVEGKEEKREKVPIFGQPTMLGLYSTLTFILDFILLLLCSLH
jgi:hypothetical protein